MQGCDCFVWWHKVLDKEMSVPLPSVNWGIFETVGIFCPYLCWTEYTSRRLLNLRKLGHKGVTVAFLPGFTGLHDQHAVEWIAANMLTCETNPLVTSCSCFIWCDSLLALVPFSSYPTELAHEAYMPTPSFNWCKASMDTLYYCLSTLKLLSNCTLTEKLGKVCVVSLVFSLLVNLEWPFCSA